MKLSQQTLEKLRSLINEGTKYRSGPELIAFFNALGLPADTYGRDFPSRWLYTDRKLQSINDRPQLEQCIKNLFAPINFVEKINTLDPLISDFNRYLEFDGWRIVRNGKDITFRKAVEIQALKEQEDRGMTEDEFLKRKFEDMSLERIGLDSTVSGILEKRIDEIKKCMRADASLAIVFLCGSTLEGLLLGTALRHPAEYNRSKSAPKDREGKVLEFPDWKLASFIDVSYEIGYLKEDVRTFSRYLRDFRNYIHPYQQMASGFDPDKHTAEICFQVLRAVVSQLAHIEDAARNPSP